MYIPESEVRVCDSLPYFVQGEELTTEVPSMFLQHTHKEQA